MQRRGRSPIDFALRLGPAAHRLRDRRTRHPAPAAGARPRSPAACPRAPTASVVDAAGNILRRRRSRYGARRSPRRSCPATIPTQPPAHAQPFTVGAAGGSGLHYRVVRGRAARRRRDDRGGGPAARDRRHAAPPARWSRGSSAAACSSRWPSLALGRDPRRPAAARPDRRDAPTRSPPATSRDASSRPPTAHRGRPPRSGAQRDAPPDRAGVRRARAPSAERLRRFLADASHELRTPLASIRGYAELFRIGAAATARRHRRKAMSRIEGEAARMGVLVEDLLTLARLDEVPERRARPRRPRRARRATRSTTRARIAADRADLARGRRAGPRPRRPPPAASGDRAT